MSSRRPDLQYTVHRLPLGFRRSEVETVFARVPRDPSVPVHAVITFQVLQPWCPPKQQQEGAGDAQTAPACPVPAPGGGCCGSGDMIDFTAGAAEFKDTSREAFVAWCEAIRAVAATTPEAIPWVDWPDPATGLAASHECGPCTYSEVDAIEQLLTYEVVHVGTSGGGCRMISHPKHGFDVYPATLLIAGDTDAVLTLLEKF
uniref:Uncharacterized protein n=1 Tax=Neobodo designis TaxID=312471 RepID=A0A7S1QHE6_NEODS